MTTAQRTFVAATLAALMGAGIFEAHKASTLATQIEALQQQQASLAEQVQQMQRERDEANSQMTVLLADNDRLNRNTSELLRLRNEAGLLRRNQAVHEPSATALSPRSETAASNGSSPEDIGRELGMAVVRGEPGAFGSFLELASAESANFKANSAGLNDAQRAELSRETFAPLHAAFKEIEIAAVGGNPAAFDAVARGMQIPELQREAIPCVGLAAGNGNDAALEILFNPSKFDLPGYETVFALQPAADSGNQKAINALAAVANDAKETSLWQVTARSLEESAGSGNETAIDALIGISASTNMMIRSATIPGLKAAAANQNAKAVAALAAMGNNAP